MPSHQVLGYGYATEGSAATIRVYDPNHPDLDTVEVVIGPLTIQQSTGETLLGILFLG